MLEKCYNEQQENLRLTTCIDALKDFRKFQNFFKTNFILKLL